MTQHRRWMAWVLAEATREAAHPTLLPWQRRKAVVAIRRPRASALQPLRAAARG